MLLTSCGKYLEERPYSLATTAIYETEEGLQSCVDALANRMRFPYSGEKWYRYAMFGTDLMQGAVSSSKDAWDKYMPEKLNSDTSELYDLWSMWYKGISTANSGLAGIGKMEETPFVLTRKAELLFYRAYFLFDLVQQFGAIPMPLEPITEPCTYIPRTPVDKVYGQIIEDLKFCADNSYLPETAAPGHVVIGAARHLLAKVYLTRGSAVSDNAKIIRGTQDSDLADALKYAEMVITDSNYELENDFSSIIDIDNKNSKEFLFSVNFTDDEMYNGDGNQMHMYSTGEYTNQPGMLRDIENGRPWTRIRQTFYVMADKDAGGLYDYSIDSRAEKTFRHVWFCNNEKSIPVWGDVKYSNRTLWSAPAELKGKPRWELDDTCIIIRPVYYADCPEFAALAGSTVAEKLEVLYNTQNYNIWGMERLEATERFWPVIQKWANPNRPSVDYQKGHRNFVVYRLGETYLIAAEAAGRLSQWGKAEKYINEIRKRAAYKDGEWSSELDVMYSHGRKMASTADAMLVSEGELSAMSMDEFVDFILDERGRELIGEDNRWNDLNRCEKLIERFEKYNSVGGKAGNIRPYHTLRPIPQKHIDRLLVEGGIDISVEQNEGYY